MLITLTISDNRESVIGKSLSSVVDYADRCLLLDTGITDNTIEEARKVVKDKLIIKKWKWQNDFAAARNVVLNEAVELINNWGIKDNNCWGLYLDTDEYIINAADLQSSLPEIKENLILLKSEDGSYNRERLLRLPTSACWVGLTHEACIFVGPKYLHPTTRIGSFDWRSSEHWKQKFIRDIELVKKCIEKQPNDPRWWYYLGDSLNNNGQKEEALKAYKKCADLRGWDEESAWACYKAASILCEQNKLIEAIDECTKGLARHAGISELAWLAGYASWYLNKPRQAVYWAKMALVWMKDTRYRIGFKDIAKLSYGPWDILRFALRAIGDNEGADEAEKQYQSAIK